MKLYLLLACLLGLTAVHGEAVTASSDTSVKPGECPKSELILGICFRRCNNDSDCVGVRKCCETPCNGYMCQLPNDKPGSCPPLEDNTANCATSTTCTSDTNCSEEQKCCPNACNTLSCQAPV
ncbi:waprin-Phi1-like [Leptodactylus fuscus]|uniref:waprin-Phi1-like n=1 Tax=Leptodactylus fuscus TaxID=238119 RepID=UPI003F4EB875